jgi:hypothetical protein
MSQRASYCHMLDGRMRIKIPEIKGTPAQASALEEIVRRLEGVTTVQAHPTTRNTLILCASATMRAEAILETLRSAGSHPSRRVPMQPRNTALPTIVVEHAVTRALGQLLLVCLRSGTGGVIRRQVRLRDYHFIGTGAAGGRRAGVPAASESRSGGDRW